jgi:hypothetical protein
MLSRIGRRGVVILITLIGVSAIGAGWWYWHRHNEQVHSRPLTFDGTSDQLQQTVIVPTLDSPIPDGKSAIWCASFQLAWNRLRDDVVKEPIQLKNAQLIADRLNRAEQSEADVDADGLYAAAGLAKDGIVKRIQSEMRARFPTVPTPDLNVPPDGAVAYAYLRAATKYEYPFFENGEPFMFKDSTGKETAVGSFGIREKDDYAYERLREQVQILYRPREDSRSGLEVPEFILDLCRTSQPYQIVLARIDRKPTLEETLADIDQKLAKKTTDSFVRQVGPNDALLVPNMAWRMRHRFKELEGRDKEFLNPALQRLYLDGAMQTIEFRMDRSGAELASESKILVKPRASFYYVNRPFLVYMKKRDSKHPFFVAWVENAELLEKK